MVAAQQRQRQTAPERNKLGAAVALVGGHCLAPVQSAGNGFALGSSAGDPPIAIARYREDSPVRLVSCCRETGSSKKQSEARSP
jgi:hypothetical protein